MTSRTDDLLNVDIPPPARKPARRLTWIWVVPLIALLIGVLLAAQAILAQGPEITLTFAQAEGLEVNKTRIKYKDVDLGIVKSISLSDDHRSVLVKAQIDKQAESLMVDDSRFWVVRPRVAAGTVSGLGTLLSGAYIAVDPGTSSDKRREFRGLDEVPLVTSDTPGKPFLLVARDLGSLDISSPVYFRRIQVGRVVSYAMREDGKGVDVRVFIDAPYDKFVVAGSRFWHASGIDFSFDANGASLNTQSLVSLALGGGCVFDAGNGPQWRGGAGCGAPLHAVPKPGGCAAHAGGGHRKVRAAFSRVGPRVDGRRPDRFSRHHRR